ncbi:hypothetical protein EDE05_102119 [Neorhizobium sp. R1-B]|uniref:DUF2232 domain-containing protein n=1 Tax=Neorhizobium sp. R1-B TaxID=2485162 RepID=UPI0010664C72|nr:DUF2232 domain-containing protein [Neorhizobium sp. R1-B]TDX88147.1 hypothetical protein EDE05_102119 [Neorhizobium sp. R1-B]
MTNKIQTVLPIGIIAGIAATLLVLGANAQSSFASLLYAASALPILIAGLGWGNRAAVVGVLTAALLGSVLVSPLFALAMAFFTLIPAGWLSHLANLARPASELGGPDHLMAWYPISDILLHLCGLVTIAVIALGIAIGYGPGLTDQMVEAMIEVFKAQEPAFTADPSAMAQTKAMIVLMLPLVQGGVWVMLLFAAFYLAVRVVSRSGRALRPREDMPSALRMNRHAIFIFLAGIVLTFLGGVPAMVGAVICGTFGAGFLMAGFASVHFRSQGKDWRVPVLILCYLSSMLLLPAIGILLLGLSDTRRTIALTPAKSPANPNENKN